MSSLPLYNCPPLSESTVGLYQSLSKPILLALRCGQCLFCCCCSLSHFFYHLRTCQCNTIYSYSFSLSGASACFDIFTNRCHFRTTLWDPHCLLETTNLTDHQSCNGLTEDTLNMSQNTAQHSDRNPHFLQCNISAQLICSSVQFIIFILADD